ncbi:MAG: hypothetical protein M3275_15575 [Thermoproteota archaeon]|nr:hypothetical protein [Thermoproteota archaeon]
MKIESEESQNPYSGEDTNMMLTFQKVANRKDLKEGSLLRVDIDGKPIVLAMVQGKG